MGKISKLFKGELKKIFLGIGIFLMSGFLILALTIAPKFFDPAEQQNITNTTSIKTTTVTDSYSSFLNEKNNFNLSRTEAENIYQDFINNNQDFKQTLLNISNEISNLRESLDHYITTGTNTQKSLCLDNLINKVEEYETNYNNFLNEHFLPFILVSEDLDFDINFELETLSKILNRSGDKNSDEFYIGISDSLENYGCAYNLNVDTKKINNLIYSNESLTNEINNYSHKNDDYKAETLNSINEMHTLAQSNEEYNKSSENKKKILNLEYSYLSIDYNYTNIIKSNLYLEISKSYTDDQLSGYLRFQNYNSYKIQEDYTRYIYLYNNKLNNLNFANVFAFNNSSSSSSKTFDYMYFTLELSSFLIILFTVVIGATIISKEYSEGTIKLLLIRPFSRNKIVFAKVLATLFFGFIFVLIVSVVSLITGCILFHSINLSESVLLIINSNTVMVIPIWLEFLMYLASLLIKIWIYALLAIAISIIFKSNILSVCLSAGVYILNLIIIFVAKGASWLKYNIFASLDLFKYFGGSFQSNALTTNQNLNSLLTSQVFAGTTIWLPIIIICSLAFILNILIFTIFKNRDLG